NIMHHLSGIALLKRHNAKRYVLEHLDQDATQAKHQHWTKCRVLRHADDHFHTWCGHRLDDDAIDPRPRSLGGHALLHGAERLAYLLAVLELQSDTAHI